MPEYRPRGRRTMSDEELDREYYGGAKKKASSKKKKSSSAKSSYRPREAPPVSPERLKRNRELQKKTEPSYAKKSRARKKRGRFTLYYVLCGILAVAAVCVLSVTVLFNISEFRVEGDSVYSDEEIIAACGVEKGQNLLRADLGQAEENIVAKLAYIDAADVGRGFPDKLVIKVEAASPAACISLGGSYYIVSSKGKLLEISPSAPDCPVITGFSAAVGSEVGAQLEDDGDKRLGTALAVAEEMKKQGLTAPCEINMTDALNITVTYDGRIIMQIGAAVELESKFSRAYLLIKDEMTETEKCTLMLTNPDRVVKRPIYDETEPETSAPETSAEETENTEETSETSEE